MSLKKKNYKERFIDKKIEEYLTVFGALSIEGPKWCGKTWTGMAHSNSMINFDDDTILNQANIDVDSVLNGDKPELIDEWNKLPKVWDRVRRKCDETTSKGNFILTCSTSLSEEESRDKIFHSGAGRIARIKMYTMSLYESGDSTGEVSITNMYNGIQKGLITKKNTNIYEIADLIVRGGWPDNLNIDKSKIDLLPKQYIEALLNKDIYDDKRRDKDKMSMLLRSLGRNDSTISGIKTIQKDIDDYETSDNKLASRDTIEDYLNVLDRLHLIDNQPAFSINYRSSKRVGKTAKRHFVDPSLAVASLNLNSKKLLKDFNTFGFLFESLVERDLKIYMDYLNGKLYHFRDNTSGDEVDAIAEFDDGEYAAIEIKLGLNEYDKAKDSLVKFYNNVSKKPKFMAMIYGPGNNIFHDRENNIYVFPITTLKP